MSGRVEIHNNILTRYLPDCGLKSGLPMFLVGHWGKFLKDDISISSGTHGIRFEGGTFLSTDLNFFDHSTKARSPTTTQNFHMMSPGFPAPNWCLELAFEEEVDRFHKGFSRVNTLFSLRGGNNTTIDEVWLFVFPRGLVRDLSVPKPSNPLPVVSLSQTLPPAGSIYFAIFARSLPEGCGLSYVEDAERPKLVGYYVIEPNMVFQAPSCSMLCGAPGLLTNELLDEMGYNIHEGI